MHLYFTAQKKYFDNYAKNQIYEILACISAAVRGQWLHLQVVQIAAVQQIESHQMPIWYEICNLEIK